MKFALILAMSALMSASVVLADDAATTPTEGAAADHATAEQHMDAAKAEHKKAGKHMDKAEKKMKKEKKNAAKTGDAKATEHTDEAAH